MAGNFDFETFLLKTQSVLENKNILSSKNNINQLKCLSLDVQPGNNIPDPSDESALVQPVEAGVKKTSKKEISGYDWKNKKSLLLKMMSKM